jgi:protease PrsW
MPGRDATVARVALRDGAEHQSGMDLLDFAPTALVAAALAPALLLLWLVVAADSRPEPPVMVWTAFVLGALSIFLLHDIEDWLVPYFTGSLHPELTADEQALFIAAIPEEMLKIFIIALFAFRARAFDEPMDGVVYGAAVGLGFAAHENLSYLTHSNDWELLAIVRGVLTVPFHGALGAIAGAYIASARFGGALGAHRHQVWARTRLLLSAWIVPVVLHTLFDIPLLAFRGANTGSDETRAQWDLMALVVGFGTIATAAWLAVRIARSQKARSKNSRTAVAAWRRIWGWLVLGAGSNLMVRSGAYAPRLEPWFRGEKLLKIARARLRGTPRNIPICLNK